MRKGENVLPSQQTLRGARMRPGLPRSGATVGWPAPADLAVRLRSHPLATFLLAFYAFLLCSMSPFFLAGYANIRIPIVLATFVLLVFATVATGHAFRFVRTPFLFVWLALLGWWLIAGATGFYKGRSISYLLEYGLRIHSLPFIFCALAPDLRGVRRVLYGAGLGLTVVLAFCYSAGRSSEGRFLIPRTPLANANDLGLHLLLIVTFFLIFWHKQVVGRSLVVFLVPVTTYYVLKTGSRANLLTLIGMTAIVFFTMPGRKKLLVMALVLVLAVATIPLLPTQTRQRLWTFWNIGDEPLTAQDYRMAESAVGSTMARVQLHRRAIQLTLQHPLLGVGPLNFTDAVEEMVQKREGHKSGWQVSHNSYLQVSSETGIPGLLFYVWTIVLCLRVNYRSFRLCLQHPQYRGAALASFCIFLAATVYAVGVSFCSIAYDYYLALVVGLSAANYRALQQEEVLRLKGRP